MTGVEPNGSLRTVVDGAEALLDRATRALDPTELVVTPERLHRRNLKRRLAERATPRSSYRLTDAPTIARELLNAAGTDTRTIDRVDRLKHVETIVGRASNATERLQAVFGSDLQAHVREIAAAHRRVAAMTAWNEDRLNVLDSTVDSLPSVAASDTADIVAGARAVEQGLTDRVGPTHSREALLREAATHLETEPEHWDEPFPSVERVSVAGISAVDAPLLDLLTAAASAGVKVTVYLRAGTGPAIAERLPDRLPGQSALRSGVEGGGFETPAVPVTELVADTPEAEGRLAAAVVARLLRAGVSPSDVLVVARDAAAYERRLGRPASRHGFATSVWAQLPVEQTLPYRLFDATCKLLGTEKPRVDSLLRPLEFRWMPPETTESNDGQWPLSSAEVAELRGLLADTEARSPSAWLDDAEELRKRDGLQAAFETYLEWVGSQPTAPEPAALHETFEPMLDAYRELVLPETFAADAANLSRTAQLARAIVRVEELLVDTRGKYDEWLATGDVPRSWIAVADLAERVVAARPGRREHANAAAVDVVDATDAWLKQVPHVVAMGLVDGEWPRRPESVFPSQFRSAVVAGDSAAARRLAVPGRWTAARETDHLASAVDAATQRVVCTRYRRTREGTAQERSPFLSTLSPDSHPETTAQSLLAAETLPEELAPANGGGSS
jgi:ATP-dependent helicase/nuclease subunit B